MNEHILIIGAGAVGQVYAYHLAQAGYHIHFLLKEKYLEEAQQGFVLYNLRQDKQRQQAIIFNNFSCHTSWQSLTNIKLSQVWLCVSSTALAAMDLAPMKAAIGDALVVVLQPDPDDVSRVQQTFGKEQVAAGMINMISYHTPLATEQIAREGIAFWIPPVMPMPVDGEVEGVSALLAVLKKAKISALWQKQFAIANAHNTGFLMVFLAALELSDWQFKQLSANKALLKTMIAAQQEVFAALHAEYGSQASMVLRQIKPWMLPVILKLARHVAPLDMETYLQAHFMKVRSQTLLLLEAYVQRANKSGIAVPNLQGLVDKLDR